jgi:hypothetical protein
MENIVDLTRQTSQHEKCTQKQKKTKRYIIEKTADIFNKQGMQAHPLQI